MKKRLAVFAHYDRDHIIDDYVVYYLNEVKKIASDIVFVSSCKLPQAEINKLSGITRKNMAEGHDEHDFGSYKRGYQSMEKDLTTYDELIFVNDSVYGPFYPLKDIWKKMDQKECDFWGLFGSYDRPLDKWHVQSYFLVIKKHLFLTEFFSNFMHAIKKENNHRDLVVKYEVGLSALFEQNDFKFATLFDKSTENSTYRNSAFTMVRDGFPVLKRRLIMENIYKVSNVYKKRKNIEEKLQENYPWQLIDNHIKRIGDDYKSEWYYQFPNIKTVLLHPKLIRLYCTNKGAWYLIRIKFLGLSIFKLPVWFNRHWWNEKKAIKPDYS